MSQPALFAPDPIDLFDPSPYTALPYYSHIAIGLVSLMAAGIALWAVKGRSLHIRAGQMFIFAVFVVCASSAAMLAVAFVPPLMLAAVTAFYAVSTAWLALQPGRAWVRVVEVSLSAIQLAALLAFLSFAVPAIEQGRVPAFAIAILAIIPLVLLAGDLNFHLRPAQRAALRIRRHLARMVWALIVVVRAPLVEVVAGGLPIPQAPLVFGPIFVGIAMVWYFQRRYGSIRVQKPSVAKSRSTAVR